MFDHNVQKIQESVSDLFSMFQSHRKKITAIDRKLFQTYAVPSFPDLLKKMQDLRDILVSVHFL